MKFTIAQRARPPRKLVGSRSTGKKWGFGVRWEAKNGQILVILRGPGQAWTNRSGPQEPFAVRSRSDRRGGAGEEAGSRRSPRVAPVRPGLDGRHERAPAEWSAGAFRRSEPFGQAARRGRGGRK